MLCQGERAILETLGSSGLSKVLHGVVRLQMDHVLRILDVLEIPPGQRTPRS